MRIQSPGRQMGIWLQSMDNMVVSGFTGDAPNSSGPAVVSLLLPGHLMIVSIFFRRGSPLGFELAYLLPTYKPSNLLAGVVI
jgi:hypothetical protein